MRATKYYSNQDESRALTWIFSINEASIKVDDLIEQKKERKRTDHCIRSEIEETLLNYFDEAKISVLDDDGKHIGTCNTKGWKEDELTKKAVATVQKKLVQLSKINPN